MLHKDNSLAFEYSFESDAANSYLVLQIDCRRKLQNHQAEIICRNPNSAFVPFHVRRENESTFIYYNITSKISLSQYLERKRLNRKELLELLRSIAKNLMQHGNYLLELSSFVVHLDFIFINPATAEASLLYLPVSCDRNSMEICKTFLKDMVVNSANVVDDNASDNYMQRILSYLKSETFSLNDFSRLIVDLIYNEGLYEPAAKPVAGKSEKLCNEVTAVSCITPTGRSLEENSAERISKRKSIIRIALLQILIILPIIIICLLLMSREIGDPVSMAAVIIIGGALDILIMKRISVKPVKTSSEEIKNKSTHVIAAKQPKGTQRSNRREVASAVDVVKACDTIMISEATPENYPYLERKEENNIEKIVINKGKFIIGRLDSMVDHIIHDGTIGKLHAEIRCREGSYYLTDLNSKNGTYINGERITSNKEYEMKSNCRIRFSCYEYNFRQ